MYEKFLSSVSLLEHLNVSFYSQFHDLVIVVKKSQDIVEADVGLALFAASCLLKEMHTARTQRNAHNSDSKKCTQLEKDQSCRCVELLSPTFQMTPHTQFPSEDSFENAHWRKVKKYPTHLPSEDSFENGHVFCI